MMPKEVLKYSLESGIEMCVIKSDKLHEMIRTINGQRHRINKLEHDLKKYEEVDQWKETSKPKRS